MRDAATQLTDDNFPTHRDLVVSPTQPLGAVRELESDPLNFCLLLLGQCATQNIGSSWGQPSECLADLEDVFLVNNLSKGAFQAFLQRRVRVDGWLQSLVAPREALL